MYQHNVIFGEKVKKKKKELCRTADEPGSRHSLDMKSPLNI